MKYIRLLLFPFSILYGIVVLVRNKLYDTGIFKQTSFDIPVICVGNLAVGGSGKSPVTEYLVNLLAGKRVAILSRGYGRKTRGYILADSFATAQTIGDEPMQFYNKFKEATVAVCEDRVKGINLLKADHDVIILDDAFQHRSVKPGFSILLFEFKGLLTTQFLLPAGNLREPFNTYHRAGAILVTKAPAEISDAQKAECKVKFNAPAQKNISFSFLTYQHLIHFSTAEEKALSEFPNSTTIFLLTGIANPDPLLSYLKRYTKIIIHHQYPDHHQFSVSNIKKLEQAFRNDPSREKIIITTEKDAQRLFSGSLMELLLNLPVFYLPVKIALQQEDKATFDQKILNYVSGTTRNR